MNLSCYGIEDIPRILGMAVSPVRSEYYDENGRDPSKDRITDGITVYDGKENVKIPWSCVVIMFAVTDSERKRAEELSGLPVYVVPDGLDQKAKVDWYWNLPDKRKLAVNQASFRPAERSRESLDPIGTNGVIGHVYTPGDGWGEAV